MRIGLVLATALAGAGLMLTATPGGAAAAGILGGLLLGAIIANQAQQQNAVEYCMRRYRSYDPYSRTYVGYDGRRHPCP